MLTTNWDGIAHNYNLATYDGTKWILCAYDLDNTFGIRDLVGAAASRVTYGDPSKIAPTIPFASSRNRLLYLPYKYDTERFKERYFELRNGPLSKGNIFATFGNFLSNVSNRVIEEEYNIWPDTPRSGSLSVDAIINFYNLRCDYLDQMVESL